jgi:hypothetical protein
MDNDWINTRIAEALKAAPVADGVVATIREGLHGALREHAVRGAEATELAKTLLTAVSDPPAKGVA